jgi:hypothetical protein
MHFYSNEEVKVVSQMNTQLKYPLGHKREINTAYYTYYTHYKGRKYKVSRFKEDRRIFIVSFTKYIVKE